MIALQDLNALDRASFVAALDGIFEHSPWIAEQAWEERPFGDLRRLHQALVEVVLASSEEDKLRLIRAHPDLVGAAARAGTLTRESTAEQARIDEISKIAWYRLRDRIGQSPAHPVDTDYYGRTHNPRA